MGTKHKIGRYDDLTGLLFGQYKVLGRGPNRNTGRSRMWLCECSCGKRQNLNSSQLISGQFLRCRSCALKARPHSCYPSRNRQVQWKGVGDMPGRYWCAILQGAKERNIEVKITKEYIWELFEKQNRRCAYTGLPLYFGIGKQKNTASLDRIDSTKGYVEGNVEWVYKKIQFMKRHEPKNTFIEICLLIVRKWEQEQLKREFR